VQPLEFRKSAPLTMGVELELQLVHARDCDLTRAASDLLSQVAKRRHPGEIKPEITESMIEVSTGIHSRYAPLRAELQQLRDTLLGRRKGVGGERAPSDPRQLGAGTLGPEPCAHLLEGVERSLQRVAGCPLLPAPPTDRSHHQVRSRQLERLTEALVQLEGALEGRKSSREVPSCGREEPAAPGCDDTRPLVLESLPSLLELADQRGCLLELPERDEGLDRVAVEAEERRLPEARLCHLLSQCSEESMRLLVARERQLEEAARGAQLEVGGNDPQTERERHALVGCLACSLDPTEMRVDEGLDRQRERLLVLLSGLDCTFVRALGVGARRLEPPAQHLDPGEIEEDVGERVLVPVVEGCPVHLV